jgi:putative addiction module killer protein
VYTILTTEAFDDWFARLHDRAAQRRIQARIDRMEDGNLGDWKAIGGGVAEARLAFGPGYRARRGLEIIVLLCGGDKSSQRHDIRTALELAAALRKE